MQLGTVGEWFSGVASLSAVIVALVVAQRGWKAAGEERRAAVRERHAERLVALIEAVEGDIAMSLSGDGAIVRSAVAQARCRALWGQRNWFATTWHVYCEEDQQWPLDLLGLGQLYPRMRDELQDALNKLDAVDYMPPAASEPLLDRLLSRLGLQRRRKA